VSTVPIKEAFHSAEHDAAVPVLPKAAKEESLRDRSAVFALIGRQIEKKLDRVASARKRYRPGKY
jgi:hypothetical protein